MANKKMIPSVGYARRSTDMQDRSIPDQKSYLEKWAGEHGHRIMRWYVDDAISGTSTRGRDDFGRMIDAAENGRDFDTILCYDMSRFSRGGTNETGYYLHRMKLAGVEVLFPADAIPEGDEGELIQGVKSWQAKQYSVKLSRDTIRGQISNIIEKHGAPGGRPPYGYDKQHLTADGRVLRTLRWLPDGRKEEFGPDGKLIRVLPSNETVKKAKSDIIRFVVSTPDRVAVVRRVFQMYLAGYGYSHIAYCLNNEGIPSHDGTAWSQSNIKRMVTNPVYRGAIAWNRRTMGKLHGVGGDGKLRPKKTTAVSANPEHDWFVVENVHEPLVPPEMFAKAKAERKKRQPMGGLAKTTNRSLLSGLMKCTHCKHNLYQKFTNYMPIGGAKQRYRYYVDGGYCKHGTAVCNPVHVPADALDAWVVGRVREAILGDHDSITAATDAFVKRVLSRRKSGHDTKGWEKKLASIEKRMKATIALLADTDLADLDELRDTLRDLKVRREALVTRLNAKGNVSDLRLSDSQLRTWAGERFREIDRHLDPRRLDDTTRQLVHAFVDRIEIDPHAKHGVLYIPADPALILAQDVCSRVAHGDNRAGVKSKGEV